MKYPNSKIYRLVCNETGLTYIGSTTVSLSRRLSKHKTDYKRFLEDKKKFMTSYLVLEKNNFDIILLEECPCENKEQLHQKERFFIESMECVNKVIPSRTPKEYLKRWMEENKEKVSEQRKKYREENKDKIKEMKKKYYEENKEEINRKKREKKQSLKLI